MNMPERRPFPSLRTTHVVTVDDMMHEGRVGETSERLRVALADRCTVTRELGAGGKATVPLARETGRSTT